MGQPYHVHLEAAAGRVRAEDLARDRHVVVEELRRSGDVVNRWTTSAKVTG